MLTIMTPQSHMNERRYIIDVVMKDWLGLDYDLAPREENCTVLTLEGSGKCLMMPETLFHHTGDDWLSEACLPQVPLTRIKWEEKTNDILLTERLLPVLFGSNEPPPRQGDGKWQCRQPFLWEAGDKIYLGLDVFAAAFFMLTRCEEYIIKEYDQHGRFPLHAALAWREGFLERPVINEYLEILWQQLKCLWPGLNRKPRRFQTVLSHDVDCPFALRGTDISRLVLSCGADIIKRRSPSLAVKRLQAWQAVKKGDHKQDLFYTFDRIMDISEKHHLKSAFFVKTARTNPDYDEPYDIDHLWFGRLLRDINDRGHEIGLHPSYETYQDQVQTRSEFHRLLSVCAQAGIQQSIWGGRQHFLRWQAPVTWRNWRAAGLDYDSTLTFPEHGGFRCGTCYEYPVYDLEQGRGMSLRERPLIIMEESVLRQDFMGLKSSEAFNFMNSMKQKCRMFKGDFTLLWHNNTLVGEEMWRLYEDLLSA